MKAPDRGCLLALALCMTWAWMGASAVSMDSSMGWDEAMHAAWPAARMTIAIGEWDAAALMRTILDCEQYPFVGPLWTALVWTVTGIGEGAARGGARVLWGFGLLGVFLLAREACRGRRGEHLGPWLALAFAAASPLALAFSGTLFLEVPTTVVAIYTLRAWLRRARGRGDVAAGTWIALLFFTKFNYALALGAGLVLDLGFEGAAALRAGGGRRFLRRCACLASVPCLAWAWWFGLPLPEGLDRAAAHRATFMHWITGNTAFEPTPYALRAVHWCVFLVWAPRVLLLMAVGSVAAWIGGPRRATLSLTLVGAVSIGLVSSHPFHLERFLLPLAPALWVLGGTGWASLLPRARIAATGSLAALAAAAFLFPSLDAWWLLDQVGMRNENALAYQEKVLGDFRDLSPDRPLFTNGLRRGDFDSMVALVDGAWDGHQRMGWCGMSPTFPPAAVLIDMLHDEAPVHRALANPGLDRCFVDLGQADPGWDDARIRQWAMQFDLLLATRPFDLAGPGARSWIERYQVSLATSGTWAYDKAGATTIIRPNGAEQAVELFALRRR